MKKYYFDKKNYLHVPFRFLDSICRFPSAPTPALPARPSELPSGELCAVRREFEDGGGEIVGTGLAPTGGLATGILGSGGRL